MFRNKTSAKNIVLLLSLVFVFACADKDVDTDFETTKIDPSEIVPETRKTMYLLADTVTYKALMRAGTLEESLYMDEWVKDLKLAEFSDKIFQAVYDNRITAHRYPGNEPMTKEEVEELEKERPRSDIAQILFEEAWYFDDENLKMYKKVHSIMLAYERKNEEEQVIGYTSGIKIFFEDKPEI